jgi:hypothetical protein
VPSRRPATVEQLAVLAAALVCGVFGLAIHVLWLVAIVLMALLLGLLAAEMRGARGATIISEVVSEGKTVVAEISSAVDGDVGAGEGPAPADEGSR